MAVRSLSAVAQLLKPSDFKAPRHAPANRLHTLAMAGAALDEAACAAAWAAGEHCVRRK
jgi:hypothetical protein